MRPRKVRQKPQNEEKIKPIQGHAENARNCLDGLCGIVTKPNLPLDQKSESDGHNQEDK